MAVAPRYRNVPIISGSYYSTYNFPDAQLATIPTYAIRTTTQDRLDTLAAQYLGADEYWWVLAMLNGYAWAFDFVPGELLQIPVDVQDVLKFI